MPGCRRSNSWESPPPITMISGLKIWIRLVKPRPRIFRFFVNQLICEPIAISCGCENAAAVDGAAIAADRRPAGFHRPHLSAARKSCSGSVGLETTPVAARAKLSVRHDRHVPDMGCHALAAAHDATVRHNATANAGTHRDIDQIIEALAGSELPLADGSGNRIVLEVDRKRKPLLQFRLQRKVDKAGEGRDIRGDTGDRIERARSGYADAHYRGRVRCCKQSIGQAADLGEHPVGACQRIRRFGCTRQDPALLVDEGSAHLRPTEVDSNGNLLHVKTMS